MDFHCFPLTNFVKSTKCHEFSLLFYLLYPMKFHGIPAGCHGIPLKCHGNSITSMAFHGIPWHSMEFHGIPPGCHRIPLICHNVHGIPWHSIELYGIPPGCHRISLKCHGNSIETIETMAISETGCSIQEYHSQILIGF